MRHLLFSEESLEQSIEITNPLERYTSYVRIYD